MHSTSKPCGFVLIIVLMMLSLLTALGLAGINLSVIDMKTASNYKGVKNAFYNAENGVEIGQCLLKRVHAYERVYNFDYLSNYLDWYVVLNQTGKAVNNRGDVLSVNFKATEGVNFKTVISMVVDPNTGDLLCSGDSDYDLTTPDQLFWTNNLDLARGLPVYKIASDGYHISKTGKRVSNQSVEVRCYTKIGMELPNAALYVNGDLISNGTPQSLIGEGQPTRKTPCNAKDIIGTNDTVNDFSGNFNICSMLPCDSNQPDIIDNAPPYPVDDLINILKVGSETILGSNHPFSQDPNNMYTVYYHNGNIMINNLTGYGVIAVDGDFTIGGGIGWNGLIVVSGDLVMNGGGNNQIVGALIVGGNATGNGNPDVYYNCDFMSKFRERLRVIERMGWKHVKEIPNIVYEEI